MQLKPMSLRYDYGKVATWQQCPEKQQGQIGEGSETQDKNFESHKQPT